MSRLRQGSGCGAMQWDARRCAGQRRAGRGSGNYPWSPGSGRTSRELADDARRESPPRFPYLAAYLRISRSSFISIPTRGECNPKEAERRCSVRAASPRDWMESLSLPRAKADDNSQDLRAPRVRLRLRMCSDSYCRTPVYKSLTWIAGPLPCWADANVRATGEMRVLAQDFLASARALGTGNGDAARE